MRNAAWLIGIGLFAASFVGCSAGDGGSNDPQEPPKPAPTPHTGQPEHQQAAYPPGPYGISKGSIITNYKTGALGIEHAATWDAHCAAIPANGTPFVCSTVSVAPIESGNLFVVSSAPNPFRNRVSFAFTLPEAATVSQAAAIMAYERIHRVPVVTTDGSVVGIVCALDIVAWLAAHDGYAVHTVALQST